MSEEILTTERRVKLQLAVVRYLRTQERYREAQKAFEEACTDIRGSMYEGERFVVKADHKHYIVTMDRKLDFDVEEIESII